MRTGKVHSRRFALNPKVSEGSKGNVMPRGKGNFISDISLIENSSLIRENSKFEVRGEEMIEKEVRQSGNSGRVYLPPDWVGKRVKIIRID